MRCLQIQLCVWGQIRLPQRYQGKSLVESEHRALGLHLMLQRRLQLQWWLVWIQDDGER
jgi:hypothetical protein